MPQVDIPLSPWYLAQKSTTASQEQHSKTMKNNQARHIMVI
jgi:hypothetical protein